MPTIVEKGPPRKPPLRVRYTRGLLLVLEIGVFATLPFMFLMMGFILPFGLIWWVFAAGSLLAAPVLAYDVFAKSTQKKIEQWVDDA